MELTPMKKRTLRKPFIVAGIVALTILAGLNMAAPALAADTRNGDYITVAANETINDDLYVFADTIKINGTIKGDLVAFGSDITIDGTVDGSVLAAGRSITINGLVTRSARMAGQVMTLGPNAQVARDVAATGYSLETQAGSNIGRDLLFAGYQALVAGNMGRNVTGAANGLELRGLIVGDVNVQVGDSSAMGASPN